MAALTPGGKKVACSRLGNMIEASHLNEEVFRDVGRGSGELKNIRWPFPIRRYDEPQRTHISRRLVARAPRNRPWTSATELKSEVMNLRQLLCHLPGLVALAVAAVPAAGVG